MRPLKTVLAALLALACGCSSLPLPLAVIPLTPTADDFPDAGAPNACDCDTGNTLPGAPQVQATLAAQYEHYIPGWDGWAGMIRVEGLHQTHSFTDPEDTVSLINKPLNLLNGRLGVENGTWGFYLWGNNLTGTYHLAGGLSELLSTARGVNLPTTYGGEVTFKF